MKGPPEALAIVGPTASGKTALSLLVADRLGCEIVSMDSRQVYRGMDVGTAKATPEQRAAVPHHGLDLVEPDDRFSAGRFERFARAAIADVRRRGRVPLLVGGTGFFLRALTHPIFREPSLDEARRDRLREELERLPTDALHRWLAELDPPLAGRLAKGGGRQRLLRALELPLLTGRPLSWWHANSPPEHPPLDLLIVALDLDRARLDERIDRRVDDMVAQGLVGEVERLMRAGYDERTPGLNATGYIELIPALRGEATLAQALEEVRRNTRAYSRRQRTWLRHQLPESAIRLDADRPLPQLADEIALAWRRAAAIGEDADDARPRPERNRHP